jgi:hypothetical protein
MVFGCAKEKTKSRRRNVLRFYFYLSFGFSALQVFTLLTGDSALQMILAIS